MKKHIKLALAAAVAVSFSALAHSPTNALVDSQGDVVRNNFGDCVEAVTNPERIECGAVVEEVEMVTEMWTLSAATLFDFDKSVIRPEGRAELTEFARLVKAGKAQDIQNVSGLVIVGHTDSRGSEAYNQGLSERRANSVRNFLIEQGLDPTIMVARGEGELNPIASNATEEGRQENRRVEISITGERVVEKVKVIAD